MLQMIFGIGVRPFAVICPEKDERRLGERNPPFKPAAAASFDLGCV
jgi:hypothetical protein